MTLSCGEVGEVAQETEYIDSMYEIVGPISALHELYMAMYMVIPSLGKLWDEGQKSKVIYSYIESSAPT